MSSPLREKYTGLMPMRSRARTKRLRDSHQSLSLADRASDGTGELLSLLVLPGYGQRPRDPHQGLGLADGASNGTGELLGPLMLPGAMLFDKPVLPAFASFGRPHNGPSMRGNRTNSTSVNGIDKPKISAPRRKRLANGGTVLVY